MTQAQVLVPSDAQIKQTARAKAREILGRSGPFQTMQPDQQKGLYLSLVQELMDKERKRHGLVRSMATDSGADMGYKGYDPSFKEDTRSFKELVDSVDFPKFVADLLKAVFDANLTVMKQQTDAYIKLLKEASKDAQDFITKVKDEQTFGRVAEKNSDKYNVTTEKGPDGSSKLALTSPAGDKVDPEDAEVQKDIMNAKIEMANEHRAALREVLLMGVTRLVVDHGLIEAGVDFSIQAARDSKSHHDDQNINVTNASTGFGGGLGALFGGPSASVETTNTNIQVNTSDKHATDDLSAKLHGKVNIQFKTDYFKLDNFLSMYGDGGTAALKPAAGGAGPAQLAGPAPGK